MEMPLPKLPPQTTNPFRFFLFVSRPHWVVASFSVLLVIAASVLNSLIPYIYKVIIDAAGQIGDGTYVPLWHAIVEYVIILFITTLLWRLNGFTVMRWSTGLRVTAQESLSSYVTLHSHQYFSDRFAGTLASKVEQATNSIDGFMQAALWQFLRFVISVITSFIVVYIASPIIAAILAALFIILTPLNVLIARKRVPLSIAAQDMETRVSGATVDIFTNIGTVHEYARRSYELGFLQKLIDDRKRASMRSWRFSEWTLLFNGVLQTAAIGAMLAVAVVLAEQGKITAGDIILFLTMISLLQDQLTFIGTQLNNFADNWGQITSSLNDILVPHSIPEPTPAHLLQVGTGSVDFKTVSFSYGGNELFKDFSLSIPGGQRLGIVGKSGGGKSTLLKLLLRHYDIQGGQILVDEQDIATLDKESLRTAIAVVPQEPSLFHRSVRDNVSYGNPHATQDSIEYAARLAEASEFISALPKGYETIVGERGTKLSGGQRQRVAIARAILKDAPLLLLDEATSALDSESEAAVQRALFNLMQGRTVIAIAHRLSTLKEMDRIIVLDTGAIIEDGTHSSLIRQGGVYARLWNHQAGGFLEE